MPLYPDNRNEQRHRTEWVADLFVQGSIFSGKLRDISRTGAFFQPNPRGQIEALGSTNQEGAVTNQSAAQLRLSAADLSEEADTVMLSFESATGNPINVRAQMRWGGGSACHACGGIGFRFEHPVLVEIDDLDLL